MDEMTSDIFFSQLTGAVSRRIIDRGDNCRLTDIIDIIYSNLDGEALIFGPVPL